MKIINNLPKKIKGYLREDGDSDGLSASFTSNDTENATEWTTVVPLSSGERHSSIFNKISAMFKNVRYIYKLINTIDITSTAPGTYCYSSNNTVHFVANSQSNYSLSIGWNTIGNIPSEFAPQGEQRRPCLITREGVIGALAISNTGTIRVYSSIATTEQALLGEVNYRL